MSFHVGQKVVCVDTAERHRTLVPASTYLRVGAVYTIRWVGECPYKPWDDGPTVRLEEIIRPDHVDIPEWNDFPFSATRFRPAIERKTDIGVFTEMLKSRELVRTLD